ncbi:MAG TPA: hypothetical protein VN282_04540 [Pyrinomonadaceae bacterium]|nr:hypothetical protein [Pyrinomonadaceae bacterium]
MKNRHTPSTLKGIMAAALVAAAAALAPAQTASSTYRASQRDPFSKYKPPVRRKVEKKVAQPVAPPPIQARIDNYKAQKQAAMSRQVAAPKPTTALLLSEAQVKGIFRTPRGYAAMVYATPIKLSYVVYPGEQFYDGMLVAIEESRLVFRKQTKMTDGKTVVAVETKPLVQPTVADQLTAQHEAEAPATPAAGEKKSEVTQLVELLKALATGAAQQQTNASAGGTAPGADAQPAPPEGKP